MPHGLIVPNNGLIPVVTVTPKKKGPGVKKNRATTYAKQRGIPVAVLSTEGTVAELRERAQSAGIKGVTTKTTKPQLVQKIKAHGGAVDASQLTARQQRRLRKKAGFAARRAAL